MIRNIAALIFSLLVLIVVSMVLGNSMVPLMDGEGYSPAQTDSAQTGGFEW